MTTQAHNEDTIKSLLEKPIEKPEPLLSEVAYSNLYSISHNVQAGNVFQSLFIYNSHLGLSPLLGDSKS